MIARAVASMVASYTAEPGKVIRMQRYRVDQRAIDERSSRQILCIYKFGDQAVDRCRAARYAARQNFDSR
jgi:hypothetical protein